MSDYIPPDASVADAVYRRKEEFRAIRERLASLSDEELRSILNSDGDSSSRLAASGMLFSRLAESCDRNRDIRQQRLVELLGGLLNDSHPDIARLAIGHCPLLEEQHIEAVRAALDRNDPPIQAAAAIALARIKDTQIFARLHQWFHGDYEGFRNVAIEGMKTLDTEEAKNMLIGSYEQGGRNEGDKVVLACALLRTGDTRGVNFLRNIANRADSVWSVSAATWLYHTDMRDEGLKLMLHILDHGNNDTKRHMVSQICSWTHSPHAFTSNGLDEARHWVQRKLESPNKSPNPFV